MFCLSIRNGEEEWQDRIVAFHKGYGMLEKSPAMQFRQEVYNAMDVGSSVVWGARHGNRADVERGRQDLERIGALLLKLLNYAKGKMGVLAGESIQISCPGSAIAMAPRRAVSYPKRLNST